MKILCPTCKAANLIGAEEFSNSTIRAVCKECGSEMVVDRDSGIAKVASESRVSPPGSSTRKEQSDELEPGGPPRRPESEPTTPVVTRAKPVGSVYSMSSEYPKYRDPLIIGAVIIVLVGILAGVHFMSKRAERSLQELSRKPVEYLTKLIWGPETYEVCESFLRHNKKQFAHLGRDLKFSLIREEISVVKGRKTALVITSVQGAYDTKNVVFRLKKRQEKWRIVYAALEAGEGKYQTLYPQAKR